MFTKILVSFNYYRMFSEGGKKTAKVIFILYHVLSFL